MIYDPEENLSLDEFMEQFSVLQHEVEKLKDQFSVPELESYLDKLKQIQLGQNILIEKFNNNMKSVNSMLLEVKGIASMFRTAVKNANL